MNSTTPQEETEGERRPDWVDDDQYPFESHYADTEAGRIHYVDEGEGKPLVMLHGNPTWSFVYRHLIRGLSEDYRCIAPDYLGFGLSEKPRNWSYRVADHARVMQSFLDGLEIEDATFFVQDWGGPIGVNYALNRPDAVDSFVVMNSAMWPLNHLARARWFSRVMGTPLARYAVRRYNVPVDWVMPLWFGDRSRFTPEVRDQYRAPLADPEDREQARVFARELVGATPLLESLWERRSEIADASALICWGMRGPLFGTSSLGRWQALFSDARTVEFPTAGHFVQDEKGPEMVPEVRQFLEGLGE